jgi:hypothetical protein
MTHFLSTPEKPDGWKLEEILKQIQNDIVRRSNKIIDDARPEARAVLQNNIEILHWLCQCIDKAEDSTRILNSFGPSRGAEGEPRIGAA